MIEIIGTAIVTSIATSLITKRNKKNKTKSLIAELDTKIQNKHDQLNVLNAELESKTFEKRNNLTKIQMDVLDIYQDTNIKIPVEIIEDLYYAKLDDHKQILDFIENQRYSWKLENSKKPFIRK